MLNIKPFIAGNNSTTLISEHQIKNETMNQRATIEYINELFQVSQEKLDILMAGVSQEMHNGLNLAEAEKSDLKMIPSFVTGTIKKTLSKFTLVPWIK